MDPSRYPIRDRSSSSRENRLHFGQAQGTPFTIPPLSELLGYTGTSETQNQLLRGTFDNSGFEGSIQLLLRHLQFAQSTIADTTRPTISDDDFCSKLKLWSESTTTSPSGMHLGHYKALIARHSYSSEAADEDLTPEYREKRDTLNYRQQALRSLRLALINYSLERGYSFQRWQKVVNTMLFKDPDNVRLHRTRVIHIYEADFNLFLGIKWREAMHQAEDLRLLNDGQFGSRPYRNATEPVFIEELQLEISRATRKPVVLTNYDATACYDRIIPNLGMTVSQKFGVPATVTESNAATLEKAEFHVRTELGISPTGYHHEQECLSLTEADSTTSIKCDVVNGGYDQKAYMLVPPQHYERVLSEFSDYKGRVFPFRQREESLVSPTESGRNDATIATKPASKDADRRGSSVSSRFSSNTSISESTVDSYQGQQSIASLPLRQHRNQDDQTVTTASSNSGKATSISSTQARFHELDAIWKRQRKDHDKLSKITDDRLSQMERQFHRLDTIDKSLQDFNTSHEEHKLRFRGLESQVVQFMERQVTMGDNVLSIEDKINSLISVVTSLAKPKGNSSSGAATTDNSQNAVYQQSQYGTDSILQLVDTGDFDSNKSSSDSSDESMSYRSTTSFPSPEKKKYALLHPAAPIPILQSVHRHTRSILAN
ncbi:hypothetical protein MHU86_820 [Fragilaria crotonensis]|nr:hypothetical protein MHU86_820 [Fragilaria crotonensis]